MQKSTSLFLSLLIAFTVTGCGSGGGGTVITTDQTTTSSTGQLADNYLENVNYTCQSGESGVTDKDGNFNCQSLPVTFEIGGLRLGTINATTADRHIFPQDLLGVERSDITNPDVVAMAQFLQSCDDDNNTLNGLYIDDALKEHFTLDEDFNPALVNLYAEDANITLISSDEAINHLSHTVEFVTAVESADIPQAVKDALFSPEANLTQEAKDTIAYMGNEERLAHDVYSALYDYHIGNGDELKQLTNIATKSETQHIQTVQLLVQKYITSLEEFLDTNKTADATIGLTMEYATYTTDQLPAGEYNVDAIQELYNQLMEKGKNSPQDALEVGCMVEVTDINDLLTDIQTAQESNADDIVASFEFLRDGSYSHYWAFDKGLKNMGIDEGCCSLGDAYCHPEYPQNTNGKGRR